MDSLGEFVALKLPPSSPSYRRIAEHVRALIVSGKCPPDSRLPSTQELAAIWQTTPQTVQKGFRLLANQHLVVRIPKKGTFVAARKPRLSTIGVYCTSFSLGDRSPFTREVLAGLELLAREEKIELAAFLDPRVTYAETGKPWSPLVKAVEERQVQAVVALTANHHSLTWLTRLKVPVSIQGTAALPNMVRFDRKQFLDLALQALRDQGCSTLGLITAEYPRPKEAFGDGHLQVQSFYAHLRDACDRLGLKMRREWIRSWGQPEVTRPSSAASFRRWGYELFSRLWEQPERPEGLLVDEDNMAEGVVMAILERQVRVPEQLKLVFQKNAHIDLFCPFPVTLVVSDEHAVAGALLEQVYRQFRGELVAPIELKLTLAGPDSHRRERPVKATEELCATK